MAERQESSNLIENVIKVNRVAKVVKGGRRFSFSSLVVVGDSNGRVGMGNGKANEVTEAIRKAVETATQNMKKIRIEGTTITHKVLGIFGAGKVLMKPARKGHGIIAAGPVRSIMEAAGIMDISVKCLGSRNPQNLVRSTFAGFDSLRSLKEAARARGKEIEELTNE